MRIYKQLIGRQLGLGAEGQLIVNRLDGVQTIFGLVATATVEAAEVLALNATPIEVIPAPPAGVAIAPYRVAIFKTGGTAYAGIAAGEDLVLKYTDASGAQCSPQIETTGFLDQAAAQTRIVHGLTTAYSPVVDAAVVLHLLSGEITTGDTPLRVRVWYDLIDTQF